MTLTISKYLRPTSAGFNRPIPQRMDDLVCVFDFMTEAQITAVKARTNVNVSTPVQAFLDYLRANQKAGWMPAGTYYCTSMLTGSTGLDLTGDGVHFPGGAEDGITIIHGAHTGDAVLSLRGAHACHISNITLIGDATTVPKTHLLLGRSSASSAGLHNFTHLYTEGSASVAGIYSIASESNSWVDCGVTVTAGGALYGFYTSVANNLSVGTLTSSSNLDNNFFGFRVINFTNDISATGILIDTSASVGSWSFFGGYVIMRNGSYVQIVSGVADGLDALGGFVFHGLGGELNGGNPQTGFLLTGNTYIKGLSIKSCRFQFNNSTGLESQFRMSGTVGLKEPDIVMQSEANATPVLLRSRIIDGIVSVGNQDVIAPTLTNSWANTFATANGVEPAGYIRTPDGYVQLSGYISNGTITASAFTLPTGYRPAKGQAFSVPSNSLFGEVVVGADGTVTPQVGSNVWVSLSGIRFKAA